MKKQHNNTWLSDFMETDTHFLTYIIQQDDAWLSEFMERAEGAQVALNELNQVLMMNDDDFSSGDKFHKKIVLLRSTLDRELLQKRKNAYINKMQALFYMLPPEVRESLFTHISHPV